jgi:thioester reductase-like protein
MALFLTGSTGYIGAHVAANLLAAGHALNLLVRARSVDEGQQRLWRSMQLHLPFEAFEAYLNTKIQVFCGDLTSQRFSMSDADYERLARTTDSVIHCAASLNRKSEKSCLNVNLRGTLEMIQFTNRAHQYQPVRRFSHVSTVAVAGERQDEVVEEDASIDWDRSDYDPYARTKKFCEHMVAELLAPEIRHLVFRPSIVLGDSRHGKTTQFEMVRSFVLLAGLPVLPFRPEDLVDIVPVEFVADAIAELHTKDNPEHTIYHLSSGTGSQTFQQLTDALAQAKGGRRPLYVPGLQRPTVALVDWLTRFRGSTMGAAANLLKVFLPYLYWNTVFENRRVVEELGRKPTAFSEYSYPLLQYSRENHFKYKYQPWPLKARESVS